MRATRSCRPRDRLRQGVLVGAAMLLAGARVGWAQSAQAAKVAAPATPAASATQAKPDSANQAKPDSGKKIAPEQLQMLVAPVALYPDDLLMQTLVASTYPLEIVQLQQWMAKNPNLKDKALADSVAKMPWDPSIQSMAALPDVVKRLSDDVQWTTDLGNAFLAQQADVMDAVQVMRKRRRTRVRSRRTTSRRSRPRSSRRRK